MALPPAHTRGRCKILEQEELWSAERLQKIATDILFWCTNQNKSRSNHARVGKVVVGASAVTGLAALGLVAALPAKGRGVLVNFLGFWLPALATIRDTDMTKDHPNKPRAFTGYWVREDDRYKVIRAASIEGGRRTHYLKAFMGRMTHRVLTTLRAPTVRVITTTAGQP